MNAHRVAALLRELADELDADGEPPRAPSPPQKAKRTRRAPIPHVPQDNGAPISDLARRRAERALARHGVIR